MREKGDFLSRLGERLDIPQEALPGGFALFLSGQRELTLQGSWRIICYERREIRLRLGKTALCIKGERLLCRSFSPGHVTICGWITALSFEETV